MMQMLEPLLIRLRTVAVEKGLSDAWASIVDPFFLQQPELEHLRLSPHRADPSPSSPQERAETARAARPTATTTSTTTSEAPATVIDMDLLSEFRSNSARVEAMALAVAAKAINRPALPATAPALPRAARGMQGGSLAPARETRGKSSHGVRTVVLRLSRPPK